MDRRSHPVSRFSQLTRAARGRRPQVERLQARILMDAAPTLSLNAIPLVYFERQGPLRIDAGLNVSAGAGGPLEAATVQVLGYQPGEDVLGVTVPNGLSAWWDPSRGVLTLSGAAPASAYQASLRSLTYADLSANPSTSARIARFLVTDGESISQPGERNLSVIATNDPPSVMTPPAQTVASGMTLRFGAALGDSIFVSDIDANGAAERVTLNASLGRLTLAETAGLNFTAATGADGSTITFTGTLDRINAALDGLTFAPDAASARETALLVSVDDLGNTGLGGAQVVTARVPIAVTSTETPASALPPSQAPPAVVQPPPDGPSLPTLPEPLTGKAPLPASLAAPPSAASQPPGEAPQVARVGGLTSNDQAATERSGGAVAAASESSTIDAAAPPQKEWTVFSTPPPAAPPTPSAFESPDGASRPAWARQLVLASAPLEAWVSSDQFEAGSGDTVKFFASIPNGETPLARGHRREPFITMAGADSDRDGIAMSRNAGFWRELNALHRRVTSDIPLRLWAGTASAVSVGASVALFLWMSRAGSLLSGMLSAMPAWRAVDPLPVLDHLGQTATLLKRNADDGIETLLRDAA
jgi:hypothetical protein